MKTERKFGLDIIRAFAICAIMLVHMVSYSGAINANFRTPVWTTWVFIRFVSAMGVPLFLLLTGYLQSSRKIDKKHYTSIIPILISYFVISIINVITENAVLGEKIGLYEFITRLFDFEYGYSWYVEMYIGLFLLIPFLNILYRNIDKKQKLILIGSLAFLTLLPSALQYYIVNDNGFEVLPDFFMKLYPITLYFIGSYIAEYKPSPNKLLCFAILLLTLAIEVALCYYYSNGAYAWWLFNNNASLPHVICAVFFFLIFWNINKIPVISAPIKWVSMCSFEMYLVFYITDKFCYTKLPYPLWQVVIIDFLMTFVAALIVRLFTVPLGNGLKNLILTNRKKLAIK
ncbi:MAG: acyltransferase family protein [Clostridia bacterium]|nr:acyltransferase family protein [Clostridia bacterium]